MHFIVRDSTKNLTCGFISAVLPYPAWRMLCRCMASAVAARCSILEPDLYSSLFSADFVRGTLLCQLKLERNLECAVDPVKQTGLLIRCLKPW